MSENKDEPTVEDLKKKSPTEIDGDQSGYQSDPRRNPEKKDEGKPLKTNDKPDENPHGGKYPTR